MSFGGGMVLGLIRFYWGVAGLLRPRCRFWPTCSHYAYEAVERHGVGHGIFLALRRLSRCRPAGPSGFDPVPEKDVMLKEVSCRKT